MGHNVRPIQMLLKKDTFLEKNQDEVAEEYLMRIEPETRN